ncbi:MAG: hypothetical protein ACQET8_19070 [Bacillota bacterium]
MAVILTVKERDRILSSLDAVQANFLQLHLKRGKKTVFANHMARDKGIVLPEDVNVTSQFIKHSSVCPKTLELINIISFSVSDSVSLVI